MNIDAPVPQPDRLVLVEIWRIPRGFFWREWIPDPNVAGGARDPSPWRRMAASYARKVLNMPNNFYTDDAFPGVTFCVRRADDGKMTGADWDAVRKL